MAVETKIWITRPNLKQLGQFLFWIVRNASLLLFNVWTNWFIQSGKNSSVKAPMQECTAQGPCQKGLKLSFYLYFWLKNWYGNSNLLYNYWWNFHFCIRTPPTGKYSVSLNIKRTRGNIHSCYWYISISDIEFKLYLMLSVKD